MALNPYFQQGASSEQSLVQDLINEQLRMYGVEVHYMPRKYANTSTIIREVIDSKFDDAYPIEAYIDNFDGYGDNTVVLSKFGINATNELTIIISKERFETYISPLMKNEENVRLSTRPKEGDLIYLPLGDRLFEIKFVEHEKPFYQLQKNYVYELRCELFRIEDEVIDTGIDEIDDTLEPIEGADDSTILAGIGIQKLTLVGTAVSVTASTGLMEGAVRFIDITNRGSSYTYRPQVAISSAPSTGVTGIATSRMLGGIVVCSGAATPDSNEFVIQKALLTNPGSGYTTNPEIRFIGGGGSGAIATAGIGLTGSIGIVTVSSGSAGYTTAPLVTFSTPKHVGAAATAVLDYPVVGGGVSVLSAPISVGSSAFLFPGGTTGGVFYKPGSTPTVTFALPTGTGNVPQATATLDDIGTTGGTVLSVGITSGGKFYDSAPTVTFSAPAASGAAATVGLAGSSIDASSVAFSTTGRAYTTAPTVAITTSGTQLVPTQAAVGIVTIHSITGVVTAVGFNSTTDAWCVGTGATVGSGYTVAPTLSFSGSTAQVRATGTASVSAAGTVTAVSIANSGFGYISAPTISFSSAGGADEEFRALGVATMRYSSIKVQGTVGIGSTTITGIGTIGVIVGDRVRLENDHSDTWNFIPTGAFVSGIGQSTIIMSEAATNVGIATSAFEFGINNCGVVTGIAVTFGGGGYLEAPSVTIQNDPSIKNYVDLVVGVHTAKGIAVINSLGAVTGIALTDAGSKYIIAPNITVEEPSDSGSGDFRFNETITGGTSNTTARVRNWNAALNELDIYDIDGIFKVGETITGSESGATNVIRISNTSPTDDGFADNDDFETEADEILDFSERNPFGIP